MKPFSRRRSREGATEIKSVEGSSAISSHGDEKRSLDLLCKATTICICPPEQPPLVGFGGFVFDFETGLQGWEFRGAAARLETTVLGGSWALFGDNNRSPSSSDALSMAIDLSGVAGILVDFLLVDPALPRFGEVHNPGWVVQQIEPDMGHQPLSLSWQEAAFIDNITLVPIPEPSTLLLLVLGGLGVRAVIGRRRC